MFLGLWTRCLSILLLFKTPVKKLSNLKGDLINNNNNNNNDGKCEPFKDNYYLYRMNGKVCDGYKDCKDGTDEEHCACLNI